MIKVADKYLEQYAEDIVDGMETEELVQFAICHMVQNLKTSQDNGNDLIPELEDYYGKEWVKKIELSVFE